MTVCKFVQDFVEVASSSFSLTFSTPLQLLSIYDQSVKTEHKWGYEPSVDVMNEANWSSSSPQKDENAVIIYLSSRWWKSRVKFCRR